MPFVCRRRNSTIPHFLQFTCGVFPGNWEPNFLTHLRQVSTLLKGMVVALVKSNLSRCKSQRKFLLFPSLDLMVRSAYKGTWFPPCSFCTLSLSLSLVQCNTAHFCRCSYRWRLFSFFLVCHNFNPASKQWTFRTNDMTDMWIKFDDRRVSKYLLHFKYNFQKHIHFIALLWSRSSSLLRDRGAFLLLSGPKLLYHDCSRAALDVVHCRHLHPSTAALWRAWWRSSQRNFHPVKKSP